jgi:hypothetical protein
MKTAVGCCHLLLLTFLLAVSSVQAQTQPRLTDLQIESFIASVKELRAMDADFGAAVPDLTKGPANFPKLDTLISDAVARLDNTVLYAELNDVVQQHGFENAKTWGRIGDRILNAYIAHQAGAHDKALRDKIAETVSRIENNPDMTEAQKKQMKALIGGTVAYVEAMVTAPQQDIDAIQPHMGALNSALGEAR